MADSKTAGEILETVVEDGRKELDRASAGLAFSGFAAGLNISFGAVAMAAVGAMNGEIGLAAMLVYPIGFLIVVIGRAQLFTENTVTPVVVVLSNRTRLMNMLRLWVVILFFNLLGAAAFAAVTYYAKILDPPALSLIFEQVSTKVDYSFATITIKGIFGGWIVALIAWMVAASQDTISQVFFIYGLAFLIPAAGLPHCVAGSSEAIMGVFAGQFTWGEFGLDFLLPTTIGNIVGGVFLVTILNYGQVVGSKKKPTLKKEEKK